MNERKDNKQKVQNLDKVLRKLQKTNLKTQHEINMNERKGNKQKDQNLDKTPKVAENKFENRTRHQHERAQGKQTKSSKPW